MKRTILMLIILLCGMISYSQVSVKGYYKSNGTYVQPHERTPPNGTITDNYSYPGNYNPNTGKVTGSSTYTSPKISDNTDWEAIGRNDLKDFDRTKNYIPTTTSIEANSYSKPKNTFVTTNTGKTYKLRLLYNQNETIKYRICEWANGDIYVFDAKGKFIRNFNRYEVNK